MYFLFRQLTQLLVFIYFKKVVVTGHENIPARGQVIWVANHPNTLMDPLIVGMISPQRIGFVGNAGIFTNKLAAVVLRYFHVIPIYRKKDVGANEKPDNTTAFARCHQYLEQGNRLLIFPEGNSYYELKLREIKTGTARIALSYEAQKGFTGNLTILPVALDYSDSIQFRSMVSVTIGKPIAVASYQALYQDEPAAVQALTADIRQALAMHVPHTEAKAEESVLIKLHKFYTAYVEPGADMHQNPARSLQLRTQLARALKSFKQHDTSLYQTIESQLNRFFDCLQAEKLTTGFFTKSFLQKKPTWVLLGYGIPLVLLMPFYLAGILVNYLPYIIPSRIFKLLRLDIEYKATIQLFAGMITFPVFYSLDVWLLKQPVSHLNLPLGLLPPFFIGSGYVAMYCWTEWKRFFRVLNFYYMVKPESKQELLSWRDAILYSLITARELLK
jgi:1-acyl-sn-glycerol-3-phosphate acyltransferase